MWPILMHILRSLMPIEVGAFEIYLVDEVISKSEIRLRIVTWSDLYGTPNRMINDVYEQTVRMLPSDEFTDHPLLREYLIGWRRAVCQVLASLWPGDTVWVSDLNFPEVLRLKTPKTPYDYEKHFMVKSRLGKHKRPPRPEGQLNELILGVMKQDRKYKEQRIYNLLQRWPSELPMETFKAALFELEAEEKIYFTDDRWCRSDHSMEVFYGGAQVGATHLPSDYKPIGCTLGPQKERKEKRQ